MSVVTHEGWPGPSEADRQVSRCAAFVDEWARAGVVHAVVCPGSRSTPLVLALCSDDRIDVHVRIDERSAAFIALGIGLATARPAIVCVTSGTAAAELHAAIVEAGMARVPMIVCTADRPTELHHVGAPQTIEQSGMYGRSVRWDVDVGAADISSSGSWRSVASRAFLEATAGPYGPGPVHLNIPAREPLVGFASFVPEGRADGSPWHSAPRTPRAPRASRAPRAPRASRAGGVSSWVEVVEGKKGVILAGASPADPELVLSLGEVLGWPVLADPRSGCRVEGRGVVAAADALLRDSALVELFKPEAVLRIGAPWASRVVCGWADRATDGTGQVLVDPYWSWADPGRNVGTVVSGDCDDWLSEQAALASGSGAPLENRWGEAWRTAEAAAQEAMDAWCSKQVALTEPSLARTIVRVVASAPGTGHGSSAPGKGHGSTAASLVVASSMPVRDVEWYGPSCAVPPATYSNRGANGIDGVTSTALGVSLSRGPTVAFVGDLAFLHDITALVQPCADGAESADGADGTGPPCTVVVADNGGGGIFSFLPQASSLTPADFSALFMTRQRVDVAAAARGLGVTVTETDDPGSFEEALLEGISSERFTVVVVKLPGGDANVSHHEELNALVVAAARSALNL